MRTWSQQHTSAKRHVWERQRISETVKGSEEALMTKDNYFSPYEREECGMNGNASAKQ